MISVGIFTGYFPYGLDQVIKTIKSHGFSNVQLDLDFRDMDMSTEGLNEASARKIGVAFRDADLPISCVSGYVNLVHPEPDVQRANLDRLKKIISLSRQLGSKYVISETGTFNDSSDWVHHPKNKTEDGYEICRDVIGEVCDFAAQHDVEFLTETYVNNVIGSVAETIRLFEDLNHPNLGLLMDPTNYFESHNIDKMDEELRLIFSTLTDYIRIAHAKDVKRAEVEAVEKFADIDAVESHTLRGVGQIDLPAPGMGSLNYSLYLELLKRDHPNIPLIIEHLDENDVPRAKRFVDQKLIEVMA